MQWHRSTTNKTPLCEASPNIAPSKPSIAQTSQAKTKLKPFQFIPGQAEEHDVNAQVEPSAGDKRTVASPDGTAKEGQEMRELSSKHATPSASQPSPVTGVSSKIPQLPHANTFPSTPGTRLPLEDLIGNFNESAVNEVPKERSPEEQIGWIAHSSSTRWTPNRKRKRARSSSPSCPNTSSQRQEASAFFIANETKGEGKTPERDPTATLWKSYGVGKEAAEGLKLPELDKLFQASPCPLETPAKNAAFRRWASTGNDWPSSKSKRRKTDGIANLALGQYHRITDSAGKSKIAGMVEKIQETLATQKLAHSASKHVAEADAPSSSSPLPKTGADHFGNGQDTNSLQSRQGQPIRQASDAKNNRTSHFKTHRFTEQATSSDESQSADDGVWNGCPNNESVVSAPLLLKNAPMPAYKRPSITRTPSGLGHQYPMEQPVPTATVVAPPGPEDDLEEFGDEFDLCAEDLEELVSQKPLHQRSLHEIPPHPNPLSQEALQELPPEFQETTKKIITSIDDDDEFGCDDLDDDALAKAEISATEAYRASQNILYEEYIPSR